MPGEGLLTWCVVELLVAGHTESDGQPWDQSTVPVLNPAVPSTPTIVTHAIRLKRIPA